MAIRQIVTDWDLPGGLAQTVMFWREVGPISVQRSATDGLWEAFAPHLSNQASWQVQNSGSVLDEVNGTLTGFWSDGAAQIGTGAVVGEPVADSSQVLIRWLTNDVADSHQVAGRSFIPGLATAHLEGGELSDAAQTALLSALSNPVLTARNNGLVVWHRPIREGEPPVTVRDGSAHTVTSHSLWQELAVQRRRRS